MPDRRRRIDVFLHGGACSRVLVWAVCAAAGAVVLAGCTSPGPSALSYSLRMVAPGDHEMVWSAAQAVLVDEGYTVDRMEPGAGLLTTHPVEVSAREAGYDPSSRLNTRRVLRRMAEVRLAPVEAGLGVYCRVAIQERTTESYRLFEHGAGTSDIPDDTAIDRGAATTHEQNNVWQTIRRDKPAEHRILDAILQRAATP